MQEFFNQGAERHRLLELDSNKKDEQMDTQETDIMKHNLSQNFGYTEKAPEFTRQDFTGAASASSTTATITVTPGSVKKKLEKRALVKRVSDAAEPRRNLTQQMEDAADQELITDEAFHCSATSLAKWHQPLGRLQVQGGLRLRRRSLENTFGPACKA